MLTLLKQDAVLSWQMYYLMKGLEEYVNKSKDLVLLLGGSKSTFSKALQKLMIRKLEEAATDDATKLGKAYNYAGIVYAEQGNSPVALEYFYKALINANKRIDLSNATLIHGGGWKKLVNESIGLNILFINFSF